MTPTQLHLPRCFLRRVRALAYTLLLSGTAWAAHGAVDIEAKFLEITQKDVPNSGEDRRTGVLSGPEARTTIETLQKLRFTDVLAAPHVTTNSGKRASISIGREFRYAAPPETAQRSQKSQPQHFLTKHVGVTLAVTPTLRRSGILTLLLEPETVEFEGFMYYGKDDNAIQQPIFATAKIKTAVSVHSGEPVVLAMPSRKETQMVVDRVPLLGRIPLLGKLFTRRTQVTLNRRLYVLVTARTRSQTTDRKQIQSPNPI